MKKFVSNIIFFLLFSALFYVVALFAWGTLVPKIFRSNLDYRKGSSGHLFSRLSEAKKTKKVDILFLGSSHTYRGFDSRFFLKNNYSSFNLGSSSQTPIQTEILLKRYLNQLNPSLIIYEVYPEIFTLDGVESSLDLIANDNNDIYTYQMAYELNHIKTYNTLLYSFLSDIILSKSFNEPISKDGDAYIKGGYVEREISFNKPTSIKRKKIEFNNSQIKIFSTLIDSFKSKNIDFILVYAPISKLHYKSYENGAEYDKMMRSFGEYYNFNEMLNLSDSLHFFDSNHLNQKGVDIFNQKLLEIINKRTIKKAPN